MNAERSARMSVEQLISTKWVVPVLQLMLDGQIRFSQLKRALPELSANVLTKRLRDLEQEGIIQREYLPAPSDRQVYVLTDRGRMAQIVLKEIRNLTAAWNEQ